MDKAKQTISSFMSHNNEHKTSVDQDQRAAVTEEHVRPERHEEVTTVIDKEVHQDHHQTIIQPIKASERLAEKHTHNAAPVQHKTFEHDKPDEAKAMLDEDAAKYRDSSVTHDTVQTMSKAPTVQGEHIHHHLHQHIQPVIQKDTIAPEVVHTTVPIHETHHAPTVNHGTATMPVKSIEEFEKEHGGLLHGKDTATVGEFDGCAKSFVEGERSGVATKNAGATPATTGTSGSAARTGVSDGISGEKTIRSKNAAAPAAQVGAAGGVADGRTPSSKSAGAGSQHRVKSMIDGVADDEAVRASKNTGSGAGLESGSTDYKVANQAASRAYNESSVPRSSAGAGAVGAGGAAAPGVAAPGKLPDTMRASTSSSQGSSGKVSLKDKLNPFKDADGDGKKGIMS